MNGVSSSSSDVNYNHICISLLQPPSEGRETQKQRSSRRVTLLSAELDWESFASGCGVGGSTCSRLWWPEPQVPLAEGWATAENSESVTAPRTDALSAAWASTWSAMQYTCHFFGLSILTWSGLVNIHRLKADYTREWISRIFVMLFLEQFPSALFRRFICILQWTEMERQF